MFQDFRLKVFMAAAHQKSFTKAAELLKVSQPAVSQNISELEKGIGLKLFERLRGEVVLTPEGEVFRHYAESMLDNAARTENLFAKLDPSTVGISVSEDIYTYYIKESLEKFSAVHPGINFQRVPRQEADLTIAISPSCASIQETSSYAIAKVSVALSPSKNKTGDACATREVVSCFDLLYIPSEEFASTGLCRVLSDFLTDFLF